jgi:hypothetical protein
MKQINSKQSAKTTLSSDAKQALQRFELENEIIDENDLYFFDETEIDRLYAQKPWKKE